ncbi:MAG TPA: toll/interleukin-1 receptor domain-containing protein [Pyrinomonadaceae bacterium]
MANEEHLKIFKQGAKVWNKWRDENKVASDLSGADLSSVNLSWKDMNLSETNLQRVNLKFAHLAGANFFRSDLTEARLISGDFYKANFEQVNLIGANIHDVDFRHGDFYKANLSNSYLQLTNLSEAKLTYANFSESRLGDTIFGNNDLSGVIGLNSIIHSSPSIIGIDTLFRSGGKIPESFLRGCGVPDEFIAYIPSIVGAQQAIQFYSCFISYSSKDEEFCKRLHSRMRAEHLRVWFAPEDVKGGEKLGEQIDRAIQMHDRLLIVLSEESLKSNWVMTEIRRARKTELREGRRKLFPIRLCSYEQLRDWECLDAASGEDLADEVRGYFIPDFSNWKDHVAFESAFDKLLKDLRAAEGSGKSAPTE